MIMGKKWNIAQTSEARFWIKKKDAILSAGYRDKIKSRSLRVEKWLKKYTSASKSLKILEIGGGGTQLVDYFSQGNRFGIDPLASLYVREFASVLNFEVKWVGAKVENLPFPANSFDVVISRNALDHVESFDMAMKEIKRIMKENGLFYLGMNTMCGPLYLFRKFHKSVEHPYVFSRKSLSRELAKSGFKVISAEYDSVENMKDFTELVFEKKMRNLLHKILLLLKSYHFCEFILQK